MEPKSFALAACVLAVSILGAGCRDTNTGGGEGGEPDSGAGEGSAVSIQEVQSDDIAEGDEVILREVVVTAVDTFGSRRGSVYVMEPEGGARSGVQVFLEGTEAADIEPGDLVDVEGAEKVEFSFSDDDTGRALTQLQAPQDGSVTVTVVGEGTIPDPEPVDPAEIAADDEVARDWQSVLVRIETVAVESAPRQIGSDDDFKEMAVTGGLPVVSELAPLSDEITVGDCYAAMTGILSYAFDYRLQPRSSDDLEPDGDACPERDDLFTVRELKQEEDVEVGDSVTVEDAVVTFIQDSEARVVIQDQTEVPEAHNGILVFRGSTPEPLPDGLEEGSVVTVFGELDEFADATQISSATIVLRDEDPVEPVRFDEDLDLDVLADEDEGEEFEHTFIELSDVAIVDEVLDDEERDGLVLEDEDGGQLVFDSRWVGDGDLGDIDVDVGDCLGTLPGIMDFVGFLPEPRVLRLLGEERFELGGDCAFADAR